MGFGIYWFRNRQVLHKFANEPTKLRVMAQKDFIFWTMRQHHREVSNGFGIAAGTFHVRLLKCRNKKINSNKTKKNKSFSGTDQIKLSRNLIRCEKCLCQTVFDSWNFRKIKERPVLQPI